ncbi:hypothetical protein K4A83_02990 [Spirulina subsalsa FACHB-351]|uniref:Glycerophosphoryl diester phosphodiesterase membrane domain-containing protein n=2 Tax=Spirulina subsalsa TaxID=54311 RepID=A0ABT3L157_9CYAN|nr:hypothetical protein [Spirulina subsalsa FACHB-351]
MQNNKPKNLSQVLVEGYVFQLEDYIKQGWQVFQKNSALFITSTFFYLVVILTITIVDIILGRLSDNSNEWGGTGLGSMLQFLIITPLEVGFYLIAIQGLQQQSSSFNDFFKGFDYFVQLVAGSLISTIFTIVGLFLCILPGIYIGVSYVLVPLLIVDRRLNFWEAMETSRQLVSRNWFGWFLLSIMIFGINLLGILACGLGVFVSLPLTYAIWTAAYRNIAGLKYGNVQDSY